MQIEPPCRALTEAGPGLQVGDNQSTIDAAQAMEDDGVFTQGQRQPGDRRCVPADTVNWIFMVCLVVQAVSISRMRHTNDVDFREIYIDKSITKKESAQNIRQLALK